jgi:uncharacterized RDD family membrane protein YckC
MKTIIIPTTQNIELEYPIASIGDRFVAFLIDMIFILAYWLVAWFTCNEILDLPWASLRAVSQLMIMMPMIVYPLFSEILYNGQTVGKYIMGMRVIKQDGSSPDFTSYFLRWLFQWVDIGNLPIMLLLGILGSSYNPVLPGLIGLVTMLINKKGQRMGDIAAGTTVVKLKLVTTFGDTIFVDTKEDYKVAFPEIEHLSDRDVSILKEVLDAGLKSNNPAILNKLANKVKEVAKIESKMEDMYFLQTVLKDYNHFYGRD